MSSPPENDAACRGRLQVQGDDVDENDPELSWPWARAKAPSMVEALEGLAAMKAACPHRPAKCRQMSFLKAERFIRQCGVEGGVVGRLSRSFRHPAATGSGCPSNARVDIEVSSGTAFVIEVKKETA